MAVGCQGLTLDSAVRKFGNGFRTRLGLFPLQALTLILIKRYLHFGAGYFFECVIFVANVVLLILAAAFCL